MTKSYRMAIADLSDDERAALRRLSAAVYPPEAAATWPGRHLEWVRPQWGVFILDDANALVSYAGLLIRKARLNGQAVAIGGIGGVMTSPEARRRGHARAAIQLALEFFRDSGDVDFGLLVCEPRLLAYYGTLGWTEFKGNTVVRQHGVPAPFTFNHVMTCAVRATPSHEGTIDLEGPPW